MTLRPFRTVTYALCIEALIVSGNVPAVTVAEAQTTIGQSPLGVFREANKPPSNSQPQQQPEQQPQQPRPNVQPQGPQLGVFREANKPAPNQSPQQPQPKPQKPEPQRIDAPLGDPQWQPKDPAVSVPQGGGAVPSMPSQGGGGGGMGEWGSNVPPMNNYQPPRGGGVFGAHNVPEPPAPEPEPNNPGLGSIAGIIPGFASSSGFGGGGLGGLGGGGLGGGALGGGALGGALLGGGMQGLFAGLNPSSIMQIAVGAGMLLSQMGQQQGQEQTSQKAPTPTPSPTVRP